MTRKKGTLRLSSNIEMRADAPLDARSIVPTKADLTSSATFEYAYVGMTVTVQEEALSYILTARDSTVVENWKAVGSGNASINGVKIEGDKQGTDYNLVNRSSIPYLRRDLGERYRLLVESVIYFKGAWYFMNPRYEQEQEQNYMDLVTTSDFVNFKTVATEPISRELEGCCMVEFKGEIIIFPYFGGTSGIWKFDDANKDLVLVYASYGMSDYDRWCCVANDILYFGSRYRGGYSTKDLVNFNSLPFELNVSVVWGKFNGDYRYAAVDKYHGYFYVSDDGVNFSYVDYSDEIYKGATPLIVDNKLYVGNHVANDDLSDWTQIPFSVIGYTQGFSYVLEVDANYVSMRVLKTDDFENFIHVCTLERHNTLRMAFDVFVDGDYYGDTDVYLPAIPNPKFDESDFTVDDNNVSLAPAQRIFTGTLAEWDALTLGQKETYGQVNITDDNDNPYTQQIVDGVIDGDMRAVTSNAVYDSLANKADVQRLGGLTLVRLTQAQYDAITTKDPNTMYIIIE